MTKGYHIFMGWGMVTATVLTAMFGLPKLAGASAALKEQARWENRAQAFQDIGQASIADIGSYSQLAANLTERHLDTSISNPWMLDLMMTQDANPNAREMVASAKRNSRELQCLAEAVYYEARSETRTGQKAVAEVVINRAASKHFPSSICGVVYQGAERTSGCQFSFACDGSTAKLPHGKHWERSQDVAAHMMMGASAPLTNRATHYHTTNVDPKWASSLRQTRQYDTHVFYRFMPRKHILRPVSVAP